ncbi:MAG: 4Fe-4S dicluster domain-containing protein [Clostridiales bacterium]|nr:4Fe-4S dicluster domain-containing protein [Clostridiales bacterium]
MYSARSLIFKDKGVIMKTVKLGKTNIEVSEVGFGVLTMGKSQMNLPVSEGSSLIEYAIERGINFFDTAEYYETYNYMAKPFSKTNKDLVLSTKSYAETKEDMFNAVEQARKALNRDVIDIFMMHEVRGMNDFNNRVSAYDELMRLKALGIIKAIGVSTHHVDMAEAAASMDYVDIVFPLINFKGLGIRKGNVFGTADEMACAIRKCSDAGKGLYAMKAFGGGNLTGYYQQALDYVYGLPGIECVMLGFGKKKEIDDICDYLDGKMSKDYVPDISKKRIHIDQGDCEGCGACMRKCPNGAIFWDPENGLARVNPDKCLTCGYCAPVCPVRAIIMY